MSKHILVVEDQADTRQIIRDMLAVIPENYIRTDSRGSAKSAHDPTRCAWSRL